MTRPGYINVGEVENLGNASVSAANDQFTLTGHSLSNGDLVMVTNLANGATVLVEGAVYYVREADVDVFRLSATRGGHVMQFDTDGSADIHAAHPQYTAGEMRRITSVWLTQAGTSDRLGARQGLHPSNTDPLVIDTTAGTVTVRDLKAIVYPGVTSTSGPYGVAHLQDDLPLEPADAAADRIDAVDLLVEDDDEDFSGSRRGRPVYVMGTAGSPPDPPPVTDNALRVDEIYVPVDGGGTPYARGRETWEVASGGMLPVRDSSQYPVGGLYSGLPLWDAALQEMKIDLGDGSFPTVASPTGYTKSLSGGVVLDWIDGGAGTNTTSFDNIDQSYDWLMLLWRGDHNGTPSDFSQLAVRINDDGGAAAYRRNRAMFLDSSSYLAATNDYSTAHAGVVGSHAGNTGLILFPLYSYTGHVKTGMGLNMIYGYDTSGQMGWQASSFKWMTANDPITKIALWPGGFTWEGDLSAMLIGYRGSV